METPFISFDAAHLDTTKVQTVCSSYLAYERVRMVRQVLIRRILVLLLGTGALTLGFHLLPTAALIAALALGGACVAIVGSVEQKARRRLAEHMRGVR